jgi:hypothetical protein
VTQPIQPDRSTASIPDRERPIAARGSASRPTPSGETAIAAPSGADTAEIGQASALLRDAAAPAASGAVGSADEARALAGRIAEALRGNASHAVQAYAGINAEAVQALLAKA